MKDKKNIERLFQETFKDFEETPRERVWENIQSKLDSKKRDKKIIPIWFWYAGVAALLLLFFGIFGKSIFNNESLVPVNNVVNTEKNTSVQDDAEQKANEGLTDSNENDIYGVNSTETNSNSNSSNSQLTKATTEEESNSVDNKSGDFLSPSSKEKIENSGLATSKNSKNNSAPKNSTEIAPSTNPNNVIVQSNGSKNGNNSINEPNKNSIGKSNDNQLASNNANKDNSGSIEENTLNPSNEKAGLKTENSVLVSNVNPAENKDNTLVEEIEKQLKQDSLTIEEAIAKAQHEDTDEKEKLVNRWQVYASIAPVYYNTLGDGSHLHEQFVHNPKSGEFNTSYGVNIGYKLSNKLAVRTGLNSLNLSYDTANVILYESVGAVNPEAQLRNIDFANNMNNNISAISADNLVVQQINSDLDPSFNAAISQRISYYEVPLELEYNLVKRKFGVQLIGGFSTFFLDGNEVYTEFENRKNYIGEANNINNISFSANLGFGLDYHFSPKFRFNLEPTFKYQLNAYSETSGNFRPYIIGVYTGFSYRF